MRDKREEFYSPDSKLTIFRKQVIHEKKQINDGIGEPILELTMWLLFAWLCVFLVIVKGVKSSGKIAYFLAIFPYVVMIILLMRICTLDGAYEGILYFFTPDFSKLLDPAVGFEIEFRVLILSLNLQVWYNSMTQMFFSLSAGMGPVIIYASYNRFDHDISK